MPAPSAAAVPTGTDTPAASKHGCLCGRLFAGCMGPLRGRDADGRMVWEPRRAPPKVGRDPRPGAASVARYECQRVVRGGGRGEGRDAVSIVAWPSAWLSRAT